MMLRHTHIWLGVVRYPSPPRPQAMLDNRHPGIELLHIRHGPAQTTSLILRLTPLHQPILALLGPTYEHVV